MSSKPYLVICGSIFFVVAVAHLTRLLLGWEVSLAGWVVPHWASLPGVLVPGALSAWGFRLASRSTTGRRDAHRP
jgi:hypothetical protein